MRSYKARLIILCLVGLLVCHTAIYAQAPYAVSPIKASLLEGSDAVVRDYTTEFTYTAPGDGMEKQIKVITVLNKNGEDAALFYVNTDNYKTLKSFSGELYDSRGVVARKIKKSDIEVNGYNDALAMNSVDNYYMPKYPSYPYTVRYVYEVGYKNGLFMFPPLSPQNGYRVAVEKAQYKLITPASSDYTVKYTNIDTEPETSEYKGDKIAVWTINDLQPIEQELFMPSRFEVFPAVFFAPHEFKYAGRTGSMESWQTLGEWQWGLLQGREELPPALKETVAELTAHAANDREKVKILYDYLGKTTRYVSIQLGIGGWQPISAANVYKNKFGDCKALTNYMKAMLKECGIDSRYTEIGMGSRYRDIFPDFANQFQTNHVILQVPLEGDTLWLECTNPEIPFGYVHGDIAGRDALVYYDGTAHLTTLPSYADSLNMDRQEIKVKIFNDRHAEAHCARRFEVGEYEDVRGFLKMDAKKRSNFVRKMVGISVADVDNIKYREDKSPHPSLEIEWDVHAMQYGTEMGDRLLFSANPFRYYPSMHRRGERVYDVFIRTGFSHSDIIDIEIPDDMKVESMPKPIVYINVMGSYISSATFKDGVISILQKFNVKSGHYPAEMFKELQKLYSAARSGNEGKIVLINK